MNIQSIVDIAKSIYNTKNTKFNDFRDNIFKQLLVKFPNREYSKANNSKIIYIIVYLQNTPDSNSLEFGNQHLSIKLEELTNIQTIPIIKRISDSNSYNNTLQFASPIIRSGNILSTGISNKQLMKQNTKYTSLGDVIIYMNIVAKLCTLYFGSLLNPEIKMTTLHWIYALTEIKEQKKFKYSQKIANFTAITKPYIYPTQQLYRTFYLNELSFSSKSPDIHTKNLVSIYLSSIGNEMYNIIKTTSTVIKSKAWPTFNLQRAKSIGLNDVEFVKYVRLNKITNIINRTIVDGSDNDRERLSMIYSAIERTVNVHYNMQDFTGLNRSTMILSRNVYNSVVNWYIVSVQQSLTVRNEATIIMGIMNIFDRKNISIQLINDTVTLMATQFKYLFLKDNNPTLPIIPFVIMTIRAIEYSMGNITVKSLTYTDTYIQQRVSGIYDEYPLVSTKSSPKEIEGAILNYMYHVYEVQRTIGVLIVKQILSRYFMYETSITSSLKDQSTIPVVLYDFIVQGKFNNIISILYIQDEYKKVDPTFLTFMLYISKYIRLLYTLNQVEKLYRVKLRFVNVDKTKNLETAVSLSTFILNKSGETVEMFMYFTLSGNDVISAIVKADIKGTDYYKKTKVSISITESTTIQISYDKTKFIIFADVSHEPSLKLMKLFKMYKFTLTKDMYDRRNITKIMNPTDQTKITATIKLSDPLIIFENYKVGDLLRITDITSGISSLRYVREDKLFGISWNKSISMPEMLDYEDNGNGGDAVNALLEESIEV